MNSPRIPLVALVGYPEGPMADAIEEALQANMPKIPGIESANSREECLACYEREIEAQRASFVELYGDPFGWEKRSEPRNSSAFAGAPNLVRVLSLSE